MSESSDEYVLLSPSEGGKARARALSAAQRSAIAKRAAQSRWDARVPIAQHAGVLDFVGIRIDCAVLPDGTRVISQGDVMEALGRSASRGREGGGEIAPFLSAQNLRPFSSPQLDRALKPIEYRVNNSRFLSTGYDATLLPEICDVYLKARRDGKLLKAQEAYAARAEILMTSLAKIGIVALVDEATGYDKVKDRDELQRLLTQFVEEQFRPWVKRFPDEFFTEVQRIYGHGKQKTTHRRPQYIGRFINDYVYGAFAPDDVVLQELQRVNPVTDTGRRARTHHQHLTGSTGIPALDRQIASVVTLMKISRDADEFKQFYAQRFPRRREVLRVTPSEDGQQVTTLFEMEDFE